MSQCVLYLDYRAKRRVSLIDIIGDDICDNLNEGSQHEYFNSYSQVTINI